MTVSNGKAGVRSPSVAAVGMTVLMLLVLMQPVVGPLESPNVCSLNVLHTAAGEAGVNTTSTGVLSPVQPNVL